jgi:hypothetical protein
MDSVLVGRSVCLPGKRCSITHNFFVHYIHRSLARWSCFGESCWETRGPSEILSKKFNNKFLESLSDQIIVRVSRVIDLTVPSLAREVKKERRERHLPSVGDRLAASPWCDSSHDFHSPIGFVPSVYLRSLTDQLDSG